jgi:hypothetical protein
MSRAILVSFLFIVVGVSAFAIVHFYTDYAASLRASLNSSNYDGGTAFQK